jgi:hypothetical protein
MVKTPSVRGMQVSVPPKVETSPSNFAEVDGVVIAIVTVEIREAVRQAINAEAWVVVCLSFSFPLPTAFSSSDWLP